MRNLFELKYPWRRAFNSFLYFNLSVSVDSKCIIRQFSEDAFIITEIDFMSNMYEMAKLNESPGNPYQTFP